LNYYHILFIIIFVVGCKENNDFAIETNSTDLVKSFKEYWPNETGFLDSTEIAVHDFASAADCIDCHSEYYNEWSRSSHSRSFTSPIFQSGWNDAISDFPNTGERFCIQCHSPIAFVTGENMDNSSGHYDLLKEGVTCTVCHSFSGFGKTINANDHISANAEYKLNPGENIMYGSIKDPIENSYHNSEFSRLYSRSDMCLPCHDFTIRGIEAEITFSEWNLATAGGMHEGNSCQSCHMPYRNGRHEHDFIGVDIDLTKSINTDDIQYKKVDSLLKTSVEIEFMFGNELNNIITNDTIYIPISIKSLIHHSLPSGTSFTREAWIEMILQQNDQVIFSSGRLENNISDINLYDPNLLLFTSNILSAAGDTLFSITKTQYYFPQLLPALSTKNWIYRFNNVDQIDFSKPLDISTRMLFRPFKPASLRKSHDSLLDNLPIFEMSRIDTTIYFN